MKVALVEVKVLQEINGVTEFMICDGVENLYGDIEWEFCVPSDLIVDGEFLKVVLGYFDKKFVNFEDYQGRFTLGAESYKYEGKYFNLDKTPMKEV